MATNTIVFVATAGVDVDMTNPGPGFHNLLTHGLGPLGNLCSMYDEQNRTVAIEGYVLPAVCGWLWKLLGEEGAVRVVEKMPDLIRQSAATMNKQNQEMH